MGPSAQMVWSATGIEFLTGTAWSSRIPICGPCDLELLCNFGLVVGWVVVGLGGVLDDVRWFGSKINLLVRVSPFQ